MPGVVIVPKILEFEKKLFPQATLSVNGIQWSGLVNGVSVAGNEAISAGYLVNCVPFGYPGYSGKFLHIEFGITAQLKALESNTALMTYRIVGRNVLPQSGWYTLVVNTNTAVNTLVNWQGFTYSGVIAPQAGFNTLPVEIGLAFACNEANIAQLQLKASSYAKALYYID